jgi:hypothetical protein
MNGSTALTLQIQHQLQTLWCWAACSSSTSEFFDASSSWTQCLIVNSELGQSACCQNGATKACNRPWYLDRALTLTGNFATRVQGPASWDDVRNEIDAGRPVGARIGWRGGGGHFVLITGYSDTEGARQLNVEDPWTGSAVVAFSDFASSYQRTGSWTHTYMTKA